MRLREGFNIPSTDMPSFVSFLWNKLTELIGEVNGRLSFGDGSNIENIFGCYADVTAGGTPDVEFEVAHTTGRIPGGFIILWQDRAGSLYKGGTTWSSTSIYLKSNVASLAAKIFII